MNEQKVQKRPIAERLLAVIDIGSNSVRLVVFQGMHRNPHVVFNERVLCGLGRGVSATGAMEDKAVAKAHATLRRFALLCREMEVDDIEAVATAAVRDSSNGPDFVQQVRADCDFTVQILKGEDEALYSGLGVLSGMPRADGIAGDLGGGSLELMRIEDGQVHERVSLPIGPLRLLGTGDDNAGSVDAAISSALASVGWLKKGKGKNFYMVGGAWRTMARIHLHQDDWPLPELHQYTVQREAMLKLARTIEGMDKDSLSKITDAPGRRRQVLPLGARILTHVLETMRPKDVVTSGQGLREGLLYNRLSQKMRETDPFLSACKEMADATGRFPEHASKLMQWIGPLFDGESKDERRLRYAICLLSDVSWKAHPDFRAKHAFNKAFYGRYGAARHRERAFVAYALYILFGGWREGQGPRRAMKILDSKDMVLARRIGLALRLGQRLTGGTSKPLDYTWLSMDDKNLYLNIPVDRLEIDGSVVRKRLKRLAALMMLSPHVQPYEGKMKTHPKLPADISKLIAKQSA